MTAIAKGRKKGKLLNFKMKPATRKTEPFPALLVLVLVLSSTARSIGEWIAALVARDPWHRYIPADNRDASCWERGGGSATKSASCREV